MTLAELKKYLSSIRSGGQNVPQINDIVDNAIEAGFASVWGAYQWKIKRKEDTSLTATSAQIHTILPDDMESLIDLVLEDGTRSRWVNIMTEENFDISYPKPSSHTNKRPFAAKLVRFSPQQNDRWRIYWYPVPDSGYTLRVVYDTVGNANQLEQLPTYMLSAVVDKSLEYVLPPGEGRLAQMQAARSSLQKAIESDMTVSGQPMMVGVDPGWNDGAFVGGRDDCHNLEPPCWP